MVKQKNSLYFKFLVCGLLVATPFDSNATTDSTSVFPNSSASSQPMLFDSGFIATPSTQLSQTFNTRTTCPSGWMPFVEMSPTTLFVPAGAVAGFGICVNRVSLITPVGTTPYYTVTFLSAVNAWTVGTGTASLGIGNNSPQAYACTSPIGYTNTCTNNGGNDLAGFTVTHNKVNLTASNLTANSRASNQQLQIYWKLICYPPSTAANFPVNQTSTIPTDPKNPINLGCIIGSWPYVN